MDAADRGRAYIRGAGVAVVTVHRAPTLADPVAAHVALRAGIEVAAWTGVVRVGAAGLRAGVRRAGVAVVAAIDMGTAGTVADIHRAGITVIAVQVRALAEAVVASVPRRTEIS